MPVENDDIKQATSTKKYDEQQLVVFKVAGEEFGVNINEVKEIIRWEDVTRIPNSAPYIKGVINLRGEIIVVNDLAMKLGLPSKDVDDDTRILVVELGDDQTVGMIVDSATEVLRLPGEKIRSAPSMVTTNIDHNYIEGVGLLDEKRLLTLLDLSKVLESEDYKQIVNAQQIAQQNVLKKTKTQKEPKKRDDLLDKCDTKTTEHTSDTTQEEKKTITETYSKKEQKETLQSTPSISNVNDDEKNKRTKEVKKEESSTTT